MIDYPVHYEVAHPPRYGRVQLLVRLLVLVVLGWVGLSFTAMFTLAYVLLPIVAAIRLGAVGLDEEEARQDRRRLVNAIHWFAAVCAWLGLTSDRLPLARPGEIARLGVECSGRPTAGSALLRLVTGLPSALVFGLLAAIGVFVWLWGAVSVLLFARVGDGTFGYLVGLQRWIVRLLAYQASLVEAYPPFSFEDAPPSFTDVSATT